MSIFNNDIEYAKAGLKSIDATLKSIDKSLKLQNKLKLLEILNYADKTVTDDELEKLKEEIL